MAIYQPHECGRSVQYNSLLYIHRFQRVTYSTKNLHRSVRYLKEELQKQSLFTFTVLDSRYYKGMLGWGWARLQVNSCNWVAACSLGCGFFLSGLCKYTFIA